jgi:hypothetical protein
MISQNIKLNRFLLFTIFIVIGFFLYTKNIETGSASVHSGKKILFTKNIAPIIYKNCTTCHRPGQVAPFSLMTYEDVQKHSKEIVLMTANRQMPPWKAKHGYASFEGERRLSDADIKMIGQWVKSGMELGEEKDLPPMPQYADAWQLGTPDLILYMPEAMTIPASGPDFFMSFVIPLNLPEDKYVKAVDILPANRNVVHHTTISMDPTGTISRMEQKYIQGQMKGSFDFGQTVGGWASGWRIKPYPEGYSWTLPKHADLLLETHFHPTGKIETERTAIGFYLTPKKQPKEPRDVLLYTDKIDLAPNTLTHIIIDSVMDNDLMIYGVTAHAHYICKEIKVRAITPDKKEVPILWIPDWDFNWQEQYRYEKPFTLPKGTRIIADFTFDNTYDNMRNPNTPPIRVKFGLQSMNEMATITLNTLSK